MALSAWITVANLAVLLVVTMRILRRVEDRSYWAGDVGVAMFIAVIALIAATGLLLTTWKPGRRVGLGLVLGALPASAVVASLLFLFAMTVGS